MPPTERNVPTSSTLHPWSGVSQNAGLEALDTELQQKMLMQSLAMEEVYLVRHGETEWNLTGRRQGQSDSPPSESGMMEVQRTAKRIESLPVDGVFFQSARSSHFNGSDLRSRA